METHYLGGHIVVPLNLYVSFLVYLDATPFCYPETTADGEEDQDQDNQGQEEEEARRRNHTYEKISKP